jgi:hypothetical protein
MCTYVDSAAPENHNNGTGVNVQEKEKVAWKLLVMM